jgi:hypothetical protein
MDNVFRPAQQLHRFRTKQPVGVRDDAYNNLAFGFLRVSVPPW